MGEGDAARVATQGFLELEAFQALGSTTREDQSTCRIRGPSFVVRVKPGKLAQTRNQKEVAFAYADPKTGNTKVAYSTHATDGWFQVPTEPMLYDTPDDGKNTPQKIKDIEEALSGARDILAERISDDKNARAKLRALYQAQAVLSSKVLTGKAEEAAKFKDYHEWSEPLAKAPVIWVFPHHLEIRKRARNEDERRALSEGGKRDIDVAAMCVVNLRQATLTPPDSRSAGAPDRHGPEPAVSS